MSAGYPGAYRHQDGQMLWTPPGGGEPHAQQQWDARCPPEWEGYNVQAAWREAEDAGWIGEGGYARVHDASGMVLIAKWGFIATAVPTEYDVDPQGRREYDDEYAEPGETGHPNES